MKIKEVMSFKELKKVLKKRDMYLFDVKEIRYKSSMSDGATYIRLTVPDGPVHLWNGLDNVGLWLCANNFSIFISRGFVVFDRGGIIR